MPSANIPYRLTVGVTGHRSLRDREALRGAVEEVLDDIRGLVSAPPGTEIAYAVLSPLAEGADRLVAEAALGRLPGCTLAAVLPLHEDDYLEDFAGADSRAEFGRLLARARAPVTLRARRLAEEHPGEMLGEARELAYEDAGRFVADHCDVLVALWDGRPSRGKGGTGETVAYARRKGCPVYVVDADRATVVERPSSIPVPGALAARLADFGARAARWEDAGGLVDRRFREVFDNDEGRRIPAQVRELVRERLLPFHVLADEEAGRAQRVYRRAGLWAFILSLAAVGTLAAGTIFLQAGPHHLPPWPVFAAELALLGVISLLIGWADRVHSHKRWMEYRLLAERLRAGIFLASAGAEAAPFLPERRRPEEDMARDWPFVAFSEIWERLPRGEAPAGDAACGDAGAFVRKHWIQEQHAHHAKNAGRRMGIHGRIEHWGEGLFFAAIAVAAGHLAIAGLWHPADGTDGHAVAGNLERLLTWLSLVLPGIAATLEGIRSHREDRRIAQQSERMAAALVSLEREFRLPNARNLPGLLRRAEQVMLDENREWVRFVGAAGLSRVV